MVSESNLKTWVSDKLMSLLGSSQPTIVQYFTELPKQASSPAQVVDKLVEFGLSSSSETRAFAGEVFSRVPHKAAGLNLYQKQEREAALLARNQRTYSILDDDDDDSKHNVSQGRIDNESSSNATSETGKGASREKRLRKKSGSHEDEDEESVAHADEERMVKRRTAHEEDGGSELTLPKLTRREEEEALRRSNAQEHDVMEALMLKLSCLLTIAIVPWIIYADDIFFLIPEKFQDEYLKKREQKKLKEIRDDIEDEQYLFGDIKVTEVEERNFRYKNKIYELAKKYQDDADKTDEYRMPDAYGQDGGVNQEKRFAVAMERYRDPGAANKGNPCAEQEAWEDYQLGKATLKSGSKNKKQTSNDYEYVFEDQIEFIKSNVMAGENFDEPPAASIEESKAQTALEKLKAQLKVYKIWPHIEFLTAII